MGTFEDFIAETQNVKIAIFEIDIPFTVPFWVNHSPGIWKYQYRNKKVNTQLGFEIGSFCYGNFENNGIETTGTNGVYRKISSVVVNGIAYTKTSSLATCKNTADSFFYDETTSILYVKFYPYSYGSIKVGVSYGFSTFSVSLDNIYYEPRIESIPQVSVQVDDLYFGIRKYSSGSVSLLNQDGYFDSFFTEDIFGQECRVKLGGIKSDGTALTFSEYKTLYTGYVQKIRTDPEIVTIDIGDKKDKIGKSLPVNYFSSSDYPDITDENDGKPIPLAWGVCKKVPCVCVNEETTTTPVDYKFVVADITHHSIKALSEVYIDNRRQKLLPTLVNDAANDVAYFIIASTNGYEAGNAVSADITGYDDSTGRDGSGTAIRGALDQIEDIFEYYLNIPYTTENFNTTQWNAEKLNDYNQGIYIDENKKISEIIETTCVGHLGIFFQTGNGKWTFKTIDDTAAASMSVGLDEIFSAPREERDGKIYLSSATVKYAQRYEPGKWKEYTDDSEESDVFNRYGIYRTQDFETYLSARADAITLANAIMTEYKTITPVFEITTTIRAANLELYDTINVEINRKKSTWLGTVKCRVMGIKYFLRSPMQMGLTLKYIEDA